MTPSGLLRGLVRAQAGSLARAVVGALLVVVAMVAVPLLTAEVIDALGEPDALDRLPLLAAGLAGLGLLRTVGGVLRKYFATMFMSRLGGDLRARLHGHLQELDLGFHQRLGSGQLLGRAAGDLQLVETFAQTVPFFVQAAMVGVSGIAVMLWIAPLVTLTVVAATVVLTAAVLTLSRTLHVTSRGLQNLLGSFTEYVEQQVRGIQVVKGHGFEPEQLSLGLDLAADVQRHGVRVGLQRARMFACLLAIPGAATLLVLALGGATAVRGDLTAGELLALVQYLGLLLLPIVVGAQLLAMWPQARAGWVRLTEVLTTAPAIAGGEQVPEATAAGLVLDRVCFGYGADVLHGVDLSVPAGTSLALVGGSGAGKSTLLALADRLYDPRSGTVSLYGVDLREWDLEALRRRVTLVFQEAQLFSTSIAANVGSGDVRAALDAAVATAFVDGLPEGADTVVGERGSTLSGGQRQRIALARGLVRDAPVLLLDDVTSALDPTSARLVRATVQGLLPGRTAVLVAQDPELAALTDRVALLDGGRVVATGTHAELLGLPEYREALGLLEEAS